MDDPVVIFDTVVFVRALINPHSFWGRLVFEHYHEYRLIVSPQLVREYVEVLQRPELTRIFSTLKGIDVTRILEIMQKADVVIPQQEPDVSRDIKDNKFLAAAQAARADYIVSEDRDLLDLDEYEGARIIPAHEFLNILKTQRKAA
jgi:putative PIN family toxin of toxin-antitoxin system